MTVFTRRQFEFMTFFEATLDTKKSRILVDVVVALEIPEVKRLKQQLTQKTENLCPGIQETKLRLPETLGEDREKKCVDKI